MSQQSLFGEQKRLEKLSMLGDDLEKLNAVIDWEMFRPILNKALKKDRKSNAGRPAYDPILLLPQFNHEYLIRVLYKKSCYYCNS